jgi:hypothetical protein
MSAIVIPNASTWATKPLQTHEAPSQSPDGRGLRGSGETPIAWGATGDGAPRLAAYDPESWPCATRCASGRFVIWLITVSLVRRTWRCPQT